MELIEGLGEAVDSKHDTLRNAVRDAISKTELTIAQIATLASANERTIYRLLAGRPIKSDYLFRIMWVLDIDFQLVPPKAGDSRSFQLVPLASSGSRRSTTSPGSESVAGGRHASADSSKPSQPKKVDARTKQGKRTSPRKPRTSWSRYLAA